MSDFKLPALLGEEPQQGENGTSFYNFGNDWTLYVEQAEPTDTRALWSVDCGGSVVAEGTAKLPTLREDLTDTLRDFARGLVSRDQDYWRKWLAGERTR